METGGAESPVQTAETKETVGFMMDPAFGYERLTRITSGAMTSCMSEPMTEGPFDY